MRQLWFVMKSSAKKTSINKRSESLRTLDFFAEAGLLKRVKRSGWWVAGIKDPESVAEHCFRCAVIGYYLAHKENVDPYAVLVMTLFNDIHEARINDLHKMGHYYIEFRDAEKKVFTDQMTSLDRKVTADLEQFRALYDSQETPEAIVARDADILECLVQAKEYLDNGHAPAKSFFRKAPEYLKTKTALTLWKSLKEWDSHHWWENVVKFDR